MLVSMELRGVPAADWLAPLLDALTRVNSSWLRGHPAAPSIYTAGVRYVAEPVGQERWRALPTVLETLTGDCEDLACARAAELRARGVDASAWPILTSPPSSPVNVWHIVVKLPDGSMEDPSVRLGMAPWRSASAPLLGGP